MGTSMGLVARYAYDATADAIGKACLLNTAAMLIFFP
jgi:hypothetical protein